MYSLMMSLQSKFHTMFNMYDKFGFRGSALKMAVTYGDSFIDDFLLSSWGLERCTVENDIEMIYLPAYDVEYLDKFNFIPQRRKNTVTGEASGSWDLLREPFEQSPVYRSFYEVFVNGSNWSQTPQYRSAYRTIQSGKRSWMCDTIDELESRVNSLEMVYESIRDDGFKTQLELYNDGGHKKRNYQKRMGDILVPNELRIAIGRNGEIIRTIHGHHRTSIMKILDRDTPIPAIIQFKHTDFSGNLPYEKVTLDNTYELVDYTPLS